MSKPKEKKEQVKSEKPVPPYFCKKCGAGTYSVQAGLCVKCYHDLED